MNEFEKSQAEKILSAYGIDINDLEKGRKAETLGTKKTWGGKEYIKTSKGWTPSKDAREAHAKIHGTTIDSTDKDKIAEGFKNPHGMNISNDPEVRAATADHAKKIIEDLHKKKKEQEFERRKNIPQEQHDKNLANAKKLISDVESVEELDKMYKKIVNQDEFLSLPPKEQIEFDDFVDDLEGKLKDKKNAFDFAKVYKGALKNIDSVDELDKQYKIVKQKQDYGDLSADDRKEFDNYVEGLKEKLEGKEESVKLSNKAEYVLKNSLEQYNKSDEKRKKELVKMVEDNLKSHENGLKTIGMGLDEDMVSAGKEFLKQVGK